MHDRIKATTAPHKGVKPRRASLVLLPALLLAGCGSSSSPNADLEARLAAVEAKAEQAEKRSREALSLASSAGSSFGNVPPAADEFPEEAGPEAGNFGDNPSSSDLVNGPPPPGPGGPAGQPMIPGQ